jgi:LysR family positive regulator for ilvC
MDRDNTAVDAFEPLRLFLHLSRTLHFGRTSLECHVSPSALSRTIQRLEQQLGTRLFVRDRRHVELTPEGQRLQEWVVGVLNGWSAFKQRRVHQELSGTLSIFCTVTASQSILPAALGLFRQTYPGVQIQLETGYAANALSMLEEGGVDVTVAALPDRLPRSLVTKTLGVTPLLFIAPTVACPVSLAVERRTIRWRDVPVILPRFGLARDSADAWFRQRRVRPSLYAEIQGHEAILSLVALGCGVGVIPALVLEKSPLRGQVRVLDVTPRLPDVRVGICTPRRKLQSPVVAALWDTVTRYTNDSPPTSVTASGLARDEP